MGMVKNELILYGVGAAVAIAAVLYLKKKAGDGVSAAMDFASTKLNPASTNNLAYGAVNQVGADLSGDKNWSLGGAIYDLFHDTYDPNAPAATSANGKAAGTTPNSMMEAASTLAWGA